MIHPDDVNLVCAVAGGDDLVVLISGLLFRNLAQVFLALLVVLGRRRLAAELLQDVVGNAFDEVVGQVHGLPHVVLPSLVDLFAVLVFKQVAFPLLGQLVHPHHFLSDNRPAEENNIFVLFDAKVENTD